MEGIILEPSPRYFKLLQINYEKLKVIHLLPYAIFEKKGKLKLFELSENALKNYPSWGAGLGSLDINHLLNLKVNPDEIDTIEIEGITFSDLLNMHPDFSRIDYLQIDTEGYDFQILKTIDFNKFTTKMIKFEFKNLSAFEQECAITMLSHDFFLFESDLDLICVKKGLILKCKL